jgi:hypothetical protein
LIREKTLWTQRQEVAGRNQHNGIRTLGQEATRYYALNLSKLNRVAKGRIVGYIMNRVSPLTCDNKVMTVASGLETWLEFG